MIIDLPDSSTHSVTTRLKTLREERGEVSTGRVLTFLVVTYSDDDLEAILESIHEASREHPARVIVLIGHEESTEAEARLDAQLRLGGNAGASEVIVLHLHGDLTRHRANVVTPLLLPDTPVVAWWPSRAPRNPSSDSIGALASRRIIDSFSEEDPEAIYRRRMTYSPGDSDLVWSRLTLWRGLLASTLDQPPYEPVLSAEVYGPAQDPAVDIAAGWFADRLDVPVTRRSDGSPRLPLDEDGQPVVPIMKAVLHRQRDDVTVEVVDSSTVRFVVGDKESRVTLSRRSTGDCLAEELRHLDPDNAFGSALRGLFRVSRPDRVRREHNHDHHSVTPETLW